MCFLQLCITAAKQLLLLRLRSQHKPPSSFPTPRQMHSNTHRCGALHRWKGKVGQCCSGAVCVCVCTSPSLCRLLPALTHWTRVPLVRLLPLAACQTPEEEACSRAERRTAGAAPPQCTTPTQALLIHSASALGPSRLQRHRRTLWMLYSPLRLSQDQGSPRLSRLIINVKCEKHQLINI